MKKKCIKGQVKLTLCVLATATLAACGGGSSSGAAGGSSAAQNVMTGTVATGNPLINAPVTVIGANGNTASATSGANGSYSVSISGLTAPFFISAVDPSGAAGTLYSVVASTVTSNGAPITANVTPLTTAVTALLTPNGNPLALMQAGALTSVTPATVNAAVSTLDTALAPLLSQNGLSPSSFDPIGVSFTPNQTGADAVIDSVAVTPAVAGTGLQLTSVGAPDAPISLNQSTTVTTPLQVPPQPANYLAPLLGQLIQCIGGTSSACSSAIDANYLNIGETLQQRHPDLFLQGAKLTGVKTIAFVPANTLTNISNPAALVYFEFTEPDGTPNFATDVVQKLPNGNWDIIGNQAQFPVYVASFIGRVQFTDAADAGNARLESGLQIVAPVAIYTLNPASIDPAAANNPNLFLAPNFLGVGSARVQGPGLPNGGLSMLTTGTDGLTIPTSAFSAPCTVCGGIGAPNGGMSGQYKWSWATLAGGTSSWSPNGALDYTAQPIDVSTVPQYATYTFTLYDLAGNQIGQPQTVLNIAANAPATAGVNVPWQTLGNDVIANLLTPGGSGTSVNGATNFTTSLDWTIPANTSGAVYPNLVAYINSLSKPTVVGTQTFPAQPNIMGYYSVTPVKTGTSSYSETSLSGFVDEITATTTPALDQAAQVQLVWQGGGTYGGGSYFSNTWQYNN